jgi:hypothetical protein
MTISEVFKSIVIGANSQVTRPNHNMHLFIDDMGILRDFDTGIAPIFTYDDITANDWMLVD